MRLNHPVSEQLFNCSDICARFHRQLAPQTPKPDSLVLSAAYDPLSIRQKRSTRYYAGVSFHLAHDPLAVQIPHAQRSVLGTNPAAE